MKKIILILIAALFVTSTAFSQILTEWEFGPTMFSPSITTNGAPDDTEIVSYIKVTNTSTSNITIKVAVELMLPVAGQIEQFCWGGLCFGFGTDTSATSMVLTPGESTEEFSGHVQPGGVEGVYIIKYSFFDVAHPDVKTDVIVHYNSIFAISSDAGTEVSEHIRFLSGTIDDPISGMIEVHNNGANPLTLIVLKGAQIVPDGTQNWFDFGGIQYPASVDTSGVVVINGTSTDESFMGYYDAMGIEGGGQIVYAFMDPTNPAAYAVMMFQFDASLGLNEQILNNTTFSAAYPNPAGSFVSFDYDIPNEVNSAQILITNLLGAVVYETTLDGNYGTSRIDVSDLTEGVYFATLKLDNYITNTQKVLVR
jgi:hypothetical protein